MTAACVGWKPAARRSSKREHCSRFVGVVMDITEQQLATQTLRQMNETLGERVQERTR